MTHIPQAAIWIKLIIAFRHPFELCPLFWNINTLEMYWCLIRCGCSCVHVWICVRSLFTACPCVPVRIWTWRAASSPPNKSALFCCGPSPWLQECKQTTVGRCAYCQNFLCEHTVRAHSSKLVGSASLFLIPCHCHENHFILKQL